APRPPPSGEKQWGGSGHQGQRMPSQSVRLHIGFFRWYQMHSTNQKRFYSPQFSQLAAVSVRRLAWAMGKPMPAAVDLMVQLITSIVDPAKVCLACQDKTRCRFCGFCNPSAPQEQSALLAAL
ncbi:MAG: hypothetical protein LBH42_01230, partial [Treponema sp.]|nr:hypothetical protein [Treponema sp.]